jgi:hypothetical protein
VVFCACLLACLLRSQSGSYILAKIIARKKEGINRING